MENRLKKFGSTINENRYSGFSAFVEKLSITSPTKETVLVEAIMSKLKELDRVKRYKIHSDGTVDVIGNLSFEFTKIKFIPVYLNKVTGTFWCTSGGGITSLLGSPRTVGRDFYCSGENLTSLEHGPEIVKGSVNCTNNSISSLKGSPKEIGGIFNCSRNKLTSLEHGPQSVGGNYDASANKLLSLRGSPNKIVSSFDCDHNSLTSLEHGPQSVGRNYDASNNNLRSLKGAPREVGGWFNCSHNNIDSLEDMDINMVVSGNFMYGFNPLTRMFKNIVAGQFRAEDRLRRGELGY